MRRPPDPRRPAAPDPGSDARAMAHATAKQEKESEHLAHASAARYWIVWVLLLAGTLLTFGASKLHFPGPYHLGIALLIACAKSGLVVLFFMHLWDHEGANRLVFATSIIFIVLLVGLVVLDSASRFELTNPGRGATLRLVPPGRDWLTPRALPEPSFPGVPQPQPQPERQGEKEHTGR